MGASRKAVDEAARYLHRKPRFADPAWTGDRDQAHILPQQKFFSGSYFFLSPHKASPLHRKIRWADLHLLHRLLREGVAYGCNFPCYVSTRDLPRSFNHSDEAVSPAGDGLYESRLLGVVLEYLANLADSGVDAVVGVEEDVLAPNPFDDLVAGHELPSGLNQEDQQLRRNPLQLQNPAGAAQFVGAQVKVEILAESDRVRQFDWLGRHGNDSPQVA